MGCVGQGNGPARLRPAVWQRNNMGKKKPFINKKTATTFTLTYGGSDFDDAADNASVSQGSTAQRHAADGASAYGSEAGYSTYGSIYEDGSYVMSAARRRELVALGFPDDGYDYLHHLKDLGPKHRSSKPHAASKPANSTSASTSTAETSDAAEKLLLSNKPTGSGSAGADDNSGAAAEGPEEEAVSVGPSVFISGVFMPPPEDVQLVDARQLVVPGKVQDDASAEEASTTVSAFARQAKGTTRRLQSEVDEIDQSMKLVEEEDGSLLKTQKPRAAGVTAVEMISKLATDDEEGDVDWDEWFDDFVVAAAKEVPETIVEGAEREEAEEEEVEEESGEEEQDQKEEQEATAGDEEARSQRQQDGKLYAASIASSYWRSERKDRRGELGGLDDRFEHLATQYEDCALGELDDEEAAGARNNAKITDFTDMLDGFLREQAEMEALQDAAEGEAHGRKPSSSAKAAGRGGHDGPGEDADGIEEYVGGDEYDDVHGLGGSDDEGASRSAGRGGRGPSMAGLHLKPGGGYNKMESLAQVDLEVIAKTRERIAQAEADAARRPAAPGPLSRGSEDAEPAHGDIFDVQSKQVFVQKDERWDCESVLSLRSNTENHPGRIVEPQRLSGNKGGGIIKLSARTGLPSGYAGQQLKAVAESEDVNGVAEADEDGSTSSAKSDAGHLEGGEGSEGNSVLLLERRKGETAEEKRARKAAVKETRRDARANKKALKTMFKEEAGRQKKQAAGKGASGEPASGSTFAIA